MNKIYLAGIVTCAIAAITVAVQNYEPPTDKVANAFGFVDLKSWSLSQSYSFKIWNDTETAQKAIPYLSRTNNVSIIRIAKVDLTKEQLKAIGKMKKIVILELSDCKLDDQDLHYLNNMASVKRLDLGENEINGSGLKYLSKMKDLRELDLSSNPIQSAGLEVIREIPELKRLNLSRTNIDDVGLQNLFDLQCHIGRVDLDYTNITVTGYLEFPKFLGIGFIHPPESIFSQYNSHEERSVQYNSFLDQITKIRLKSLKESLELGEVVPDKINIPRHGMLSPEEALLIE